ncbi:hypothetical protein E2C01_026821 [Portunus trituberculatus]|uniref:Uncharacterized protein n=1 Tax=Portunus trituberculatus TaxID=210409 RepID=A0A5B7EGI5_PORTR|nr:hypothetical protein [Portunus trituberculatus]
MNENKQKVFYNVMKEREERAVGRKDAVSHFRGADAVKIALERSRPARDMTLGMPDLTLPPKQGSKS